MLDFILKPITSWVIGIISDGGYIAVAILMAIESAAIPLPSEIIMPFAGFLVYQGNFTLLGAALAGAVGSVLGSWVIYALAALGGRPLVERYGHYLLISGRDLDLADRFFKKFGAWATFIGRMVPIVRTYISVPAGVARMPFWPFTAAAFLGSFIWSYLLAYLGFKLGEHWQSLHERFQGFDIVIAVLLLTAIGYYIYRHIKRRRVDRGS